MDRATARVARSECVDLLADADALVDWPDVELDRSEGLRSRARLLAVGADVQLGGLMHVRFVDGDGPPPARRRVVP